MEKIEKMLKTYVPDEDFNCIINNKIYIYIYIAIGVWRGVAW